MGDMGVLDALFFRLPLSQFQCIYCFLIAIFPCIQMNFYSLPNERSQDMHFSIASNWAEQQSLQIIIFYSIRPHQCHTLHCTHLDFSLIWPELWGKWRFFSLSQAIASIWCPFEFNHCPWLLFTKWLRALKSLTGMWKWFWGILELHSHHMSKKTRIFPPNPLTSIQKPAKLVKS